MEKVKRDNIWFCDKEKYFCVNVRGFLKCVKFYFILSKFNI